MSEKLTRQEQETVINYNNAEGTATCYTMDARLIRKLDNLCSKSEEIALVKTGEGLREYCFPEEVATSAVASTVIGGN